jgi:diaminopropionate ammonia-lyase family
MSTYRRPIYVNPAPPPPAASSTATLGAAAAEAFHRQFPGYTASPLVALPGVADELGVRGVYVKQESDRFGLPSFKVLGASWAIYQAVRSSLGLPDGTPLEALVERVRAEAESATTPITLVAATEGNHGRAVARVARHMSLRCSIYVPCAMHAYTRERIRSEGADVTVVEGDYDRAVQTAAAAAAGLPRGILVQDTALEGYEEIPAWVVEGYTTLLREADAQLHALGLQASLVVAPVGVGSFAQAVATHYKSRPGTPAIMVAVEPDTAPGLTCSLQRGELESVVTSPSIMAGMNCGTVSSAAWPLLQQLVDVSVTVSDWESHCAVQDLAAQSIDAGPCGAATLAATRRLKVEGPTFFSPESVILLLSTEGSRPYEVPADVSVEDPVALTQVLTRINSSNPTLSKTQGAGEESITNYLCAWFAHRAIEYHRIETTPGRPSVVGIVRGSGGGASLMLNGHVDTVSLATYEGDALTGHLGMKEGKEVVFGRGTLDMKGGLAAGLSALLAARARRLAGDVMVAAVADEEDASQGTRDVLAAGCRADAGVVLEPTNLAIATAHKGFVWVEVEVLGRAAHGSQLAEGVDAILNMGLVLQALREYQAQLPVDPVLGPASLHCGLIRGGEEVSSYPASCTLTLEYRTVPAQTNEGILAELGALLKRLGREHPGFQYRAPRITMWRPSQHVPRHHAVVQHLVELGTGVMGRPPPVQSVPFWCDAALLTEAGIPSVVFGPSGAGLHSREEWVDVDSLRQLREVLAQLIQRFCQ